MGESWWSRSTFEKTGRVPTESDRRGDVCGQFAGRNVVARLYVRKLEKESLTNVGTSTGAGSTGINGRQLTDAEDEQGSCLRLPLRCDLLSPNPPKVGAQATGARLGTEGDRQQDADPDGLERALSVSAT